MFTLPPWPPKDYVLKDVPNSQLSGSEFSPYALPRVTQPNLGFFSSPVEYDDSEIVLPQIKAVHPRVLDKWSTRARAYWVDKPGKDAGFLHHIHQKYSCDAGIENNPIFQNKEKVFNRPFKCELDCTEFCRLKKLQEKSDRERQAVCKTITLIEEMKRLKQQEEDAVKLVSCKWLPPFWWEAARIVDSQDVPEVPKTGTDYSRSQPISYARWQEEPHFFSKTVDPCVRRNELLLVGRPFCNEACNWYYEQYPPPNLVHRLKRFM